jgi:spermidine synthase
MSAGRVVHTTRSAVSGLIRVVETRQERRLLVGDEVCSAVPVDGDWSRLRHEYWWHALAGVSLPPRPSALFVGLGGGTQVHLLHQRARPRLVTVIERDPAVIRIAGRWFGLARLGPFEYLCADALEAATTLARLQRRFDFVMEDAAYGDTPDRSRPLALALPALVAPRGALVINRHRRGDAKELATLLRPRFESVTLRRIRREGENVLITCLAPRMGPPRGKPAAPRR